MSQGILIWTEHLRGQVAEITYEMLGLGRQLADALKVPLAAVVAGENVTSLASQLGMADKVLLVENPALTLAPASTQASVLQALMQQEQAALILVGGTNVSLGVGAVLACRTKLPFVNFCKAARVEDGAVMATSQLFGGKVLADTRLADHRGIISVYPGAFPAEAGRRAGPPELIPAAVEVTPPPVKFVQFIEPETGDVDITKQDILVAVGRGIQSQDNVALAEELATALGGAVCASRPVIDQGWLPLSRQVGKSGMTVKPRLYLALGISGAPEHWEGMQGSRLIVAVNTDPKAPIFDGAHFGATVDALDLLPVLTEKVKARKG
ncbi:MAG: electron transfer flavoprotein subunit alpha/FixB family protein [Verrucomicrobiae bacterium]|nr:electron transfer flavoprotein subunit alpha/FixB family protein [Verrucomicrobiae bacterium]